MAQPPLRAPRSRRDRAGRHRGISVERPSSGRDHTSGPKNRNRPTNYNESFMSSFKAFRITNIEGKISAAIVDTSLDELTPGDLVIKAEYSSVHYHEEL